jgi:hypothetical protein
LNHMHCSIALKKQQLQSNTVIAKLNGRKLC